MARKATTSKKNAATKQTAGQRAVRWLFSPLRLFVVAVISVTWLFWPQVQQQLPQLDSREEYRVTVAEIQVTPPPRWVPEDIVEKVFARAKFDEPLSLLDPDLTEKIALAFYTHPWIEQLKQVRKNYPARINVEVVYRRPVAMVEVVNDGYYPIDRFGCLLPHEDFSAADIDRYPLITQVRSVPAGRLGEAWGDPAVLGAAQLAAVLGAPVQDGPSWWDTLGLKSIVAPKRTSADDQPDDMQFRIATTGGTMIAWGRSPESGHPGELTVAQKLKRLADYHESFNGFDDSPAPFLIDIRHWQGTGRSLLASEEPTATQ